MVAISAALSEGQRVAEVQIYIVQNSTSCSPPEDETGKVVCAECNTHIIIITAIVQSKAIIDIRLIDNIHISDSDKRN